MSKHRSLASTVPIVHDGGGACFCRGALRGVSPRTREGRLRPTAPMDDSIWVADTWARLWLGPKSNSLDALCEYFRRSFFDH